ncbi:MAG: sulfatase-like hydrolase/transferase, partial [Bacteroidales bacterium]|nr:sulfatase-like hydrolase/transferase [Bacteroidales bacterium]
MKRLFLTLLIGFVYFNGYSKAPQKPNVIIIFVDDMGYADPSCFGNPLVKTPHIDK